MKNQSIRTALIMACVFSTIFVQAQISGTVFRDYNNNSTRETSAPNEPLANGVVINAYNASDILIATATTAGTATPNYSFSAAQIPNGTAIRLEFVLPAAFGNGGSTLNGTGSATSVRFLTAGAAAININYGISNNKEQFSNTVPLAIPRHVYQNFTGAADWSLVTSSYSYLADKDGNINTGGGTNDWNVSGSNAFGNPNTGTGVPTDGTRPAPTNIALNSQIGTTYGLAYATGTKKLFVSAYLRRKGYLTSNGLGAIWVLNNPTGAVTPSLYVDLNTVFANAFGTNPRTGTGTPPAPLSGWNDDREVIPSVHKRGIGDIDINNTEDTIYAINLNNRRLYAVPTSGALNTTTIKNYDFLTGVASLTGVGSFTNADIRPFGLGTNPRNSLIYIGAVYSAQTSGAQADMRALVWTFNPANGVFTLVLNQSMNYNRSSNGINSNSGGSKFDPWTNFVCENSEATCTGAGQSSVENPQAVLSDIRFDGDVMLLGFKDRYSDLTPNANAGSDASADPYSRGDGEILRAHISGVSYIFESNGSSVNGNTGAAINSGVNTLGAGGIGNGGGPGGGEFYFQDWPSDDGYWESAQGALFFNPGTDEVVTTAYDPVSVGTNGNKTFTHYNTGGFQKHSNITGRLVGAYDIYEGSDAHNFAKCNGLGDIEGLYTALPIEIGNRVWNDANGNGVQDAGEVGIGNVQLQIFADFNNDGSPDGAALGTTTTATSGDIGSWYFNASNIVDGDPGVAGNQAGPQPGKTYLIRIAAANWSAGVGAGTLLNYRLTKTDIIGSGAVDLSDNDAIILSNIPTISVTTGNNGENNHNFDIGFTQLAALGDRVWLDNNSNGTQDAGEPGVAGISVQLFRNGVDGLPGTADDILVSSTVTDAYGNYLFESLAISTNAQTEYNIKVTPPANYTFTTQTNTTDAGDNATGSDVNAGGRSYSINLSAGEVDLRKDAGLIFYQPITQSLGDRIWLDINNNGTQDGTEPGMAGVVMSLYFDADNSGTITGAEASMPYLTTITDANGNYRFTNLPVGNYQVGITLPAGFTYTTYNAGAGTLGTVGESNTDSDIQTSGVGTGKTPLFNFASGLNLINVDGGLIATASTTSSLGDFVWNDLNQDGIQNAGEPGLAGVTVTLYAADGTTVIATTVTNAFGGYMFTNLAAGSYVIGITPPAGYTVSPKDAGTDDLKDSDISTVTNKTGVIVLPAGQRNTSIDAGLYQTAPTGTAKLGDKVWFDNGIGAGTASNGVQDGTEPGVGGVTVTLYNNAGVAIATTATDANGNYLFTGLAAGTYSIGFSNLPAGYSFTPVWSSNGANATNSDANPGTGRTGSITVAAGSSNLNYDAGLIAGQPAGTGSLGNKVFYDINNNGIQNAGETGVSGVTVTLQYDANNDGSFTGAELTFATQTTNSLGEYLFTGLNAGDYRVVFSNGPTGYNIATANAGTDDNLDSDGSNAGSAISSTTSTTATYNLAQGENNLSVDLGIVKTNAALGSISDRVWFDLNSDGTRNATEPGVAGVTVTLTDAAGTVIAVTTTDANGYYLFDNLAAKTTTTNYYQVTFSNFPPGLVPTNQAGAITNDLSNADGSGRTQRVNLNASQNRTDVDFGLRSTRASLGNFVWLDSNGNGTQDAGEPGISGVTVLLYFDADNNGTISGAEATTPVASMITDQNGNYLFTNLNAGNYQVAFTTIPGGLVFTQQNTPGDNGNDTNSDANPTTGRSSLINLATGEADLTIDAGLYRPIATVGDYVWADNDGSNTQTAGDQGVAGVLVTLYTSAGVPVSTMVTDKNGKYLFTNVAPGNYYVGFSNTPNGSIFVSSLVGGDNTKDSDVSGSNGAGTTATFSVPYSSINITLDAGLVYVQTLPVGIEFTAVKSNTVSVLNWNVTDAAEVNQYTIERSADGRSYLPLKVEAANGGSRYDYNDVAPYNGINYYRIKITNVDGSVKYSEVRIVVYNGKGIVQVFPNPAKEMVNVKLPDNWQRSEVKLSLYNQAGQLVASKMILQSSQVETLSVQGLANGMYHLQLQNAQGERIDRKVQIVK